MLDYINITKALSDENRVRILMALYKTELCVCQVTTFLDLAPSTTSKHLSILKQARLIESKKRERWVYYSLNLGSNLLAKNALTWLYESLKNNQIILDDHKRLELILANDDKNSHANAIHQLDDENNFNI